MESSHIVLIRERKDHRPFLSLQPSQSLQPDPSSNGKSLIFEGDSLFNKKQDKGINSFILLFVKVIQVLPE